MNPVDAHLVAGFLLKEFTRFEIFLDACAVDTVEASMIVDAIAAESDGRMPTNIQQLLGDRGVKETQSGPAVDQDLENTIRRIVREELDRINRSSNDLLKTLLSVTEPDIRDRPEGSGQA